MQKRIIAFIDILGFKQALEHQELFDNIYALISTIAATNSSHSFVLEPNPSGYRIEGSPEVSSFSDHVVISLDDKSDNDPFKFSGSIDIILDAIARICDFALFSGFLVRGGMTYGEVIHKSNVVFGRALVEAVSVEENLAVHPRILLTNSILSKVGVSLHNMSVSNRVCQDHDGLIYANWMGTGRMHCPLPNGKDLGYDANVHNNYIERMRIYKSVIESNLTLYKDDHRKYRHWHWLGKNYNHNVAYQQQVQY